MSSANPNMMKQQYSVIIPLYNKQDTIKRAIDSVLKQLGHTFEIIVVDDGSRDHGIEFVEQYGDPRIRCLRQANRGVSAARNTGWAAAQYPFVCFLDADDEWDKGFLDRISGLIDHYPQAAVFGCAYWIDNGRRRTPVAVALTPGYAGLIADYFQTAADGAPPLFSSSICILKDALQNTGGFPDGVKTGEDLFVWARLAKDYPIAYCNFPSAVYYQEPGHFFDVRRPPVPDVFGKNLLRLIKEKNTRGIRHYYSNWMKMRAFSYLCLGERVNGIKTIATALCYRPFKKSIGLYLYLALLFLPHRAAMAILYKLYQKK